MKQTREHGSLWRHHPSDWRDLAISLAVYKPDDPTAIESITILRTPKYEAFLNEWERAASVIRPKVERE